MVKESWLSTFFVNTIYFDDVENVVFGQNNQMELIMKDDSRMLISFGGYTKKIQSKIIAKLKKQFVFFGGVDKAFNGGHLYKNRSLVTN